MLNIHQLEGAQIGVEKRLQAELTFVKQQTGWSLDSPAELAGRRISKSWQGRCRSHHGKTPCISPRLSTAASHRYRALDGELRSQVPASLCAMNPRTEARRVEHGRAPILLTTGRLSRKRMATRRQGRQGAARARWTIVDGGRISSRSRPAVRCRRLPLDTGARVAEEQHDWAPLSSTPGSANRALGWAVRANGVATGSHVKGLRHAPLVR
jgi:hypothetical protein